MKSKKSNAGITDFLLIAVGLIFLAGIRFVFYPCAVREDGSWMTCHWAGQALTGIAALLLAMALLHLLLRDAGQKQGIDLAMLLTALLAIAIPGHLIDLCMMADMRCRQVTAPGAVVCAVLTMVAAAADFLVQRKRGR